MVDHNRQSCQLMNSLCMQQVLQWCTIIQSIPLFCNHVTCFTKFLKLPTSFISLPKHKSTEAVSEFPFQITAVVFFMGKNNPKYRAVTCRGREDALNAVGEMLMLLWLNSIHPKRAPSQQQGRLLEKVWLTQSAQTAASQASSKNYGVIADKTVSEHRAGGTF